MVLPVPWHLKLLSPNSSHGIAGADLCKLAQYLCNHESERDPNRGLNGQLELLMCDAPVVR